MFRMEFQSVDKVEDGSSSGDDITESVYERYRDVSCSARRPAIFEGRVGQFGRVQRVSTSTTNAVLTGFGNWKEADLMHFDAPSLQGVAQNEETHQAIFLDAQVLRELMRPFAELPSAAHMVADVEGMSASFGSVSLRSTSSCGSDCSSSVSEGSIAEMDALQRVNKGWEEPLVALQKQTEVNLRALKEKRAAAKRLVEDERIEAVRQQRQLRDLANCVHDVSPRGKPFKRNKLQRVLNKTGVTAVCRFLKNPFRVFKSHKIHEGYPNAAREGMNAVMMPRRARSAFFPSETAAADAALAQMRSAPRKARSLIQFETVQSIQRDVEAWTMEEYMTRNARLHKWNRRKDDEEFGGIEGNNLMKQYFDDDVMATYDSDSD